MELQIASFNKIRRTLSFIHNSVKKTYYVDNNKFIFIYDGKFVYGFSLNTAEFYGFSKDKIKKLIKSNENNKEIANFYSLSNDIRRMVDNQIPNELVLLDFF